MSLEERLEIALRGDWLVPDRAFVGVEYLDAAGIRYGSFKHISREFLVGRRYRISLMEKTGLRITFLDRVFDRKSWAVLPE